MSNKKKAQDQSVVILNDDANLDDLSFLDWQAPDNQLDAEIYPFVQWSNTETAWEFPLDQWGGSLIDQNYDTVEVVHNFGQDSEPAMLVPTIHIAVIAQRTTWESEVDRRRVYSATYEKGMHKRYNFLVLVKETESSDPVIITARSYTGACIQNAIKQHRTSVLKLASRLGKGTRYPTYMFWLPLVAGEKVFVGSKEKSQIQPPVPAFDDLSQLPQDSIADLVKSLYIGDDYRQIINDYLYTEGTTWANEHQQQLRLAAGNGGGSVQAEILAGNVLFLPDLADRSKSDWIECAMSIPGLFDNESHAANAFAKVLRTKGLIRDEPANQWEAWREEIERRFADKVETERVTALEAELQHS